MHRPLALVLLFVASPGCAVPELRHDQDRIREALLDLYTDQILDNLVRATNGLPIIQLDYTNASSNVSLEQTANVSNAIQTTSTSMLTLAAKKMLATTYQTVDTISASLGANNSNNVALTATPVLTTNMLYNAYLTYLGIPGSFQVTEGPPPCGAAHVCKRYRDKYYWVPVDHKSEFFDLALITTTQRDRLLVSPDKYPVTLLNVDLLSAWQFGKGADLQWQVDVDIDKAVPSGEGWLFTRDGLQLLNGVKLTEYIPWQKDETNKYYIRKKPQKFDPQAGQEGNKTPQEYYAIDENHKGWEVEVVEPGKTYRLNKTKMATPNIRDYLLESNTRVFYTNKIRVNIANSLLDQWLNGGLPMPAQVKLVSSRPSPPTTDELLDRMPFLVPQINTKPPK